MIYFTIKKLNENKAFLAMLCFLFVFSCSKDKKEGNGDTTKYTLTITKPTGGTITSDAGGINCGSKDTVCKAEFDKDTEVILTAKANKGYVPVAWQGACDKTTTDQPCKLTMNANKTVGLTFTNDIDGDRVLNVDDVDDNNNGLIEVHNLDMFDHIQYSLDGTSYKTGADAEDNRDGAPDKATDDCQTATMDEGKSFYLCGYELMRDLDFSDGESYADGSVNTDWRPNDEDTSSATNAGFVGATDFAGLFDGNGYNISNLYSRHTASSNANIGLFAKTTATATIRKVGVVAAMLYGGGGVDSVGTLVGRNEGSIVASFATGAVHGGGGNDDVGGLVGRNEAGSIVASFATGAVDGGGGHDRIGGLVGWHTGNISASYATGAVNGGVGVDRVGGLIGEFNGGDFFTPRRVIASYATGEANGGDGDDEVGSLVGAFPPDSGADIEVIASYATGNANGGNGNDHVGILIGRDQYATTTTITDSYGFGRAMMGTALVDGDPGGLTINGLTATVGSAGIKWNDASEKTKDAWDFGTSMQAPALRYADYDGVAGMDFSCDMFPTKIPGTDDDLECGKSLLPGQRR